MDFSFSHNARGFAGLIALVAWVGLVVQFDASSVQAGSRLGAVSAMLRYFTVLTNLALAVMFTSVALDRMIFATPSLLGGATLAIALVGVVFTVLLRGSIELSGGAKLANFLLHYATPILTPLFWLGYAPKGLLDRRDPWLWMAFPLAYFMYALVRGGIEGFYAYPFMDVGRIGWMRTGINVAVIALGFVLAGQIMLWLDGRLTPRTT
jgi:hypothetical protein